LIFTHSLGMKVCFTLLGAHCILDLHLITLRRILLTCFHLKKGFLHQYQKLVAHPKTKSQKIYNISSKCKKTLKSKLWILTSLTNIFMIHFDCFKNNSFIILENLLVAFLMPKNIIVQWKTNCSIQMPSSQHFITLCI
jgi:hypothetical protein